MAKNSEDGNLEDEAWAIILLSMIYRGIYSPKKLPKKLYEAVLSGLMLQLSSGFGNNGLSEEESEVFGSMEDSLRAFAAAKVFDFVLTAEGLMVEGDEVISFDEFKKKGIQTYRLFFKTWQKAEEETAKEQGRASRDEIEFKRRLYTHPILEYVAMEDERTCEVCGPRHGVRRKWNDPWWLRNGPPVHSRCRCYKVQLTLNSQESGIPENLVPKESWIPDSNSGEVFTKEHPYFTEIPKNHINWAKKNFGLY
jgi:SPP1 gp7 family putative phage head morphogenesis protein